MTNIRKLKDTYCPMGNCKLTIQQKKSYFNRSSFFNLYVVMLTKKQNIQEGLQFL